MDYVNEVTLCGKVGNVITKNNGFCEYTCFTLVTECVVRNPNHDIVDITWHNIFSPISLTILKGDMVKVKGSLRTKRVTDKDGNERYCVEVVAKEVETA